MTDESQGGTMLILKAAIFIVVSVGIFVVSWQSLRNPRSHGFYRFFAFESILILIPLNLERWLSDPFSINQIVSWLLLLCSVVLAAHGFYLLHVIGRPRSGIENTTTLVMIGAYKYIRHPLYSSLLFLAWGAFFKSPSWLGGILALAASVFLVATAKVEESENNPQFWCRLRCIYENNQDVHTLFVLKVAALVFSLPWRERGRVRGIK